MEKMLVTRSEAAEALRISVDTLDRLTEKGYIKRLNIGTRIMYLPDEVQRFVALLAKKGGVSVC